MAPSPGLHATYTRVICRLEAPELSRDKALCVTGKSAKLKRAQINGQKERLVLPGQWFYAEELIVEDVVLSFQP